MALQTFHTEFDGVEASLAARLVDDEPWFRGAEAATALGYKNPQLAIRTHVDDEDKTTLHNLGGCENLTLTNPNEGAAVYISESGLYALIMRSKLPAAKLFKRWVLKEVLPTIRRTGSYTATRSASPQLTDAIWTPCRPHTPWPLQLEFLWAMPTTKQSAMLCATSCCPRVSSKSA